MRKLILAGLPALIAAACSPEPKPAEISVIPQPSRIIEGTGFVKVEPDRVLTVIDTTIGHPEGYRLMAENGKVTIVGGGEAGVFYGLQTLEQLKDSAGRVPAVTIEDAPRFPWRGMHLDVSRHFFSKDFIKKYLDILAYHKINTFHWHLTDGIGWRLQIDRYPRLTQKAAWRKVKDEKAPWIGLELSDEARQDSADTYGGYYTKEDVREIVSYARERHITVVPEIEMPGHSEAATFAYPEYSCPTAQPGSGIYCPGKEETFAYLERIIDEVIELFPDSPYIHIGGDEVDKEQWSRCPLCRKRMREEGLENEHELQSYFVHRMEEYINSKGKAMIGWDEILEGGLAPNATVMSWTGFEGGIKAANAGHNVVMVPLDYVYFDHYQGQNPCEPQAWGGFNGIKRVYSFDPVPAGIAPENVHYVLGGQGNLWTENIRTPEHAEYMLLPRLAALSEALWSDTTAKDWGRFERKLDRQLERYAARGWNYAESAFTPYIAEQRFDGDGSLVLRIATELEGCPIRYTLDGSAPTADSPLYADSLVVDAPATLTAQTFRRGRAVGCLLVVPQLLNRATRARVSYATPYSPAYTGGGDTALVDNRYAFKRGDDRAWQGFEGTDMEVTLDLGTVQQVEGIVLRFLQHIASTSVMLPTRLTVWTSADGRDFSVAADVPIAPDEDSEVLIRPFDVRFQAPVRARYVRVRAENRGTLPEGHPRAGAAAWIFTDEIAVY
ncbi:family 20 glycosylhydrolase [uncultured Rikenella sp.]|uniref:glycoside hydrolase family 20 protein n=1 Tax=uncultured Rikenella sp. TaxID=368003 RepID=UPI00261260F3|nr:family 20 glycosylhydrolase [uncultured Rikenella sp.]